MALITMALDTCNTTPATTLAWLGAYRTTTPSTVAMLQWVVRQVGIIIIKLAVGTYDTEYGQQYRTSGGLQTT